jgi:hypothetical protein
MSQPLGNMPPHQQQKATSMFKIIGASVVYGFALFGLAKYLTHSFHETEV